MYFKKVVPFERNRFLLLFFLLPFFFAACTKKPENPVVPPEKFLYTFPLNIGKNWTYQHFLISASVQKPSSSNTPDTVIWRVTSAANVSGKQCKIISSIKKGSSDTVFGAYLNDPDSGLYCWALDTAFSGQELLKRADPGFKKFGECLVPPISGKTATWNFQNNKGQEVTKTATLSLNKSDTVILIQTSISGKQIYKEKFSNRGLLQRVYDKEKYFDDISKDTIVVMDSLVLIGWN